MWQIIGSIAIILFPLWLLVFYDIYKSETKRGYKYILYATNLVFYLFGSFIYLFFVFLEKEKSYIRTNMFLSWKHFKDAFNKKIVAVSLVDLIAAVCITLTLAGSVSLLNTQFDILGEATKISDISEKIQSGAVDDSLEADMANAVSMLRGFFIKFGIALVLLFLFIVLIWTIFKGWVWSYLTGKKISFSYHKKLFVLNLALFFLLLLVYLGILFFVKEAYLYNVTIVTIIISMYVSYILYYYFAHEQSMQMIKKSLKTIFNVKQFVMPYIMLALLYIITAIIYNLFNLIPYAGLFLGILTFTLYFAFAKSFAAEILRHMTTLE